MNTSFIAAYLPTVVIILAIVFTNWRTGAKQVSTEVLANYEKLDKQQKEQIDAYKKDIAEIRATMRATEMTFIEKISKLEGQLSEKDKRVKDLELIVTNRNPDLEKILSDIRDFMKRLSETNTKQTRMLETATGVEHSINP
jgi:chromosome segregation ATPase